MYLKSHQPHLYGGFVGIRASYTMHLISSRPAAQADIAFLLELRRQTRLPQQIASGVTQSEEEQLHRVLSYFEWARLLILENKSIGLFKAIRDSLNWKLLQIPIIPSMQSKGIGTWLVQQLVSEAQLAHATIHLSVLKANPARRPHERLGFSIVPKKAHAFKMQNAPKPLAKEPAGSFVSWHPTWRDSPHAYSGFLDDSKLRFR